MFNDPFFCTDSFLNEDLSELFGDQFFEETSNDALSPNAFMELEQFLDTKDNSEFIQELSKTNQSSKETFTQIAHPNSIQQPYNPTENTNQINKFNQQLQIASHLQGGASHNFQPFPYPHPQFQNHPYPQPHLQNKSPFFPQLGNQSWNPGIFPNPQMQQFRSFPNSSYKMPDFNPMHGKLAPPSFLQYPAPSFIPNSATQSQFISQGPSSNSHMQMSQIPFPPRSNQIKLEDAKINFKELGKSINPFSTTSMQLEQKIETESAPPTLPIPYFDYTSKFADDSIIENIYIRPAKLFYYTEKSVNAQDYITITNPLKLPANLLHPDFTINNQAYHEFKEQNPVIPPTLSEALEEIRKFTLMKKEALDAFIDPESPNIKEKLFRFFVNSLHLTLLLGIEITFPNPNMRCTKFESIDVFQFFYLWKLAKNSQEKLKILAESVQNFSRFLRIQEIHLHEFKTAIFHDFDFIKWLDDILLIVKKENKLIENTFAPRSKINKKSKSESKGSSPHKWTLEKQFKKILLSNFKEECDEIVNFSEDQISHYMNELQLQLPYCKEITTKEYVIASRYDLNRKKNQEKNQEKFLAYPVQLHSTPYIAYLAENSKLLSWGHTDEGSGLLFKNHNITVLKAIKLNTSKSDYTDKELEDKQQGAGNELQKKLLEDILNLKNRTSTYFFVNKSNYFPCNTQCKQRANPFLVDSSFEIAQIPSWDSLEESYKKTIIQIWKRIVSKLNSLEVLQNLKKAAFISEKSRGKTSIWLLNLLDFNVHQCFFPLLKKSIHDEIGPGPIAAIYEPSILFIASRLFEIFSVHCSDIDTYKEKFTQSHEDKKLINLISTVVGPAAISEKYKYSINPNKLFYFINESKKKECQAYINSLENDNKEFDLNFDQRPAILISKNKSDKSYYLKEVTLDVHGSGLRDIMSTTLENSKITNHIKTEFNNGFVKDIVPVLEFIASSWKNNEYIVPLFEDSLSGIQQQQQQQNKRTSKETGLRLDENNKRKNIARTKRKKLTATTEALTKYIEDEEVKKNEKKESKAQKKHDDDDLALLSNSLSTLPDFLLEMQISKTGDFFDFLKNTMVTTYHEVQREKFEDQINSSSLQFFGVPNDGELKVEERHKKLHLIDSLREEQQNGIARFEVWKEAGCGGIIADEPGMGKTRTASEMLLRTIIDSPDRPCFVICPSKVKSQWPTEFNTPVNESAKNLYFKVLASPNASEELKQIAREIRKLANFPLTLILKSNIEITEDDAKKLKLFRKFYEHFPSKATITKFNESTVKLCSKVLASPNASEELKQMARDTRKLANFPLTLIIKSNIEITKEDAEELEKSQQFYKNRPQEPIISINTPQEFKALIEKSKKERPKGIIVVQKSYLLNQFDLRNPQLFENLDPQLVIMDEAHDAISQSETDGIGITTRFDYLFRRWKDCIKIGLTATPIINDMFDICELLTILTNKERNLNAAEHFGGILYNLADKIAEFKEKFETTLSKETPEIEKNFEKNEELYTTQILQLARNATLAFAWLKEKMINPRVSRATRLENEKNNKIIKKDFSIKLVPTEEQIKLHDNIHEKYNTNFFKFSTLISGLLIHPDLVSIDEKKKIKEDKKAKLIQQINKQKSIKQYIKRSSLLTALFLEKHASNKEEYDSMTIADAMEKKERAIIFVTQINHAEFIKEIAKRFFKLNDRQVFAVHSKNDKSEADIEAFKKLQEEGLMVLLDESGGAGLNFPKVILNIIAALGWTHKDYIQCGGRHQRGEGKKYLGKMDYPFDSSNHVANIIKKKELLSDLFLDIKSIDEFTLQDILIKILMVAESTVRACRAHSKSSPEWDAVFKNLIDSINTTLNNCNDLHAYYQNIKRKAEAPAINSNLPINSIETSQHGEENMQIEQPQQSNDWGFLTDDSNEDSVMRESRKRVASDEIEGSEIHKRRVTVWKSNEPNGHNAEFKPQQSNYSKDQMETNLSFQLENYIHQQQCEQQLHFLQQQALENSAQFFNSPNEHPTLIPE